MSIFNLWSWLVCEWCRFDPNHAATSDSNSIIVAIKSFYFNAFIIGLEITRVLTKELSSLAN